MSNKDASKGPHRRIPGERRRDSSIAPLALLGPTSCLRSDRVLRLRNSAFEVGAQSDTCLLKSLQARPAVLRIILAKSGLFLSLGHLLLSAAKPNDGKELDLEPMPISIGLELTEFLLLLEGCLDGSYASQQVGHMNHESNVDGVAKLRTRAVRIAIEDNDAL